ncbi:MAG: hypothetical protein Kow006_16630 [Gammaproteobacteria bacterium]
MAFHYTIHSDENWIECHCLESFTEQDIREGFERYVSDPGFRKGMSVLLDLRQAELGDRIGSATVQNFVELLKANRLRRGTGYRIALVVRPGLQETLAHLFSIYARSQPVESQVFDAPEKALQWIRETAKERP